MSWSSPREPRWRWLVVALSIALGAFAQMGRAQEHKDLPAPKSPIGMICANQGTRVGGTVPRFPVWLVE